MAFIKKRKKIYYVYWYDNGTLNGKAISSDLQTALNYKTEIENKLRNQKLKIPVTLTNKDITWKDFLTQYLKYSSTDKSIRTHKIEQDGLKNFTRIVNPVKLKDITTQHIEYFKQERNKEVSETTVNIGLRVVKTSLNKAYSWELIEKNPVKNVKYLKVQGRIRFLTKEEAKKLLDACDSILKPIVLAFLHTGMRRGELLNLTWEDINFERKEITIQPKEGWCPKGSKTRVIPLHPVLEAELKKIRQETGPVFKTLSGIRIADTIMQRKFRYTLKKANIDHCRIHDLRHTFASALARAGVDIYRISKLLGHSSVKTTEIYAHLIKSDLIEAIKKLDI